MSRHRAIVVILALSLILAWLIFEGMGDANPIRDAFSRVLSPIQFATQRMTRPLFQATGKIKRLAHLAAENEALHRENAELRSQIILLQEAQIENETLRRQLNFKSAVPNYRLLSAEVIGHDPSNLLQYLIIDRGAADGIERGMPVLAATGPSHEGLVGRISQVSASSSQVMLITDPSSSVSALIQRSRATGIVQGYSGQELLMRYIPAPRRSEENLSDEATIATYPSTAGSSAEDMVTPGDIVLTSGLGGNFPKRLIIAQVANIRYKDVEMFQEAKLIPAVNLRDLEAVMVLLNFTPLELASETPTYSSTTPTFSSSATTQ